MHHLSPANKMKWSFLDYVQLLMISWAGQWTQTLSATLLQPINEMLIWIMFQNEHFILWLDRDGGWGLSPSTSPADHQKLNIIQK